jgi:hypothetical protein
MVADAADTSASIEVRVLAVKRDALRNALYHTARRRHFESMGRFLNFLVIIAGAATLAEFPALNSAAYLKSLPPMVSLLAGTIALVYDFSGQARDHQFLQSRYYEILSEVEAAIQIEEVDIHRWIGQMTKIYADEPPMLRALDAVAYNEASDSLGGSWRVRVSWLQNLTRHYWAWEQASFKWDKSPESPAE